MNNQRPIICGPGDKLRFLEGVANDDRSTAFDVRLAVAISNRINKYAGTATIDQTWLANFIHSDERSVRRAAVRLEQHGHVSIQKSTGRGKAHVYRPCGKGDTSDRVYDPETRTSDPVKADSPSHKGVHASPPLPNNYLNSSFGPTPPRTSGEAVWLSVRERLARALGRDVEASWFGKLQVEVVTNSDVVLRAPSEFMRHSIERRFPDRLLIEWRAVVPTVERVCLVARALRAAE
jgi:hypothetical protein